MLELTLDIGFLKRRFPTLNATEVPKPAIAIGIRLFVKFIPIAVRAVPGLVAKSASEICSCPDTSVKPLPPPLTPLDI